MSVVLPLVDWWFGWVCSRVDTGFCGIIPVGSTNYWVHYAVCGEGKLKKQSQDVRLLRFNINFWMLYCNTMLFEIICYFWLFRKLQTQYYKYFQTMTTIFWTASNSNYHISNQPLCRWLLWLDGKAWGESVGALRKKLNREFTTAESFSSYVGLVQKATLVVILHTNNSLFARM